MEKIKVLCIATHIMEMTRMLPEEKKRALQRFCDEIQLKKFEQDKKQNEVFLKKQMEYYSKNIDLYSVKKVSNVQFSQNDEDFLKSLYKRTKKEGGFRDFYEKMLNEALTQQKQKTDRKFQQNNEKKQKEELEKKVITGGASRTAISALDEAVERDSVQEFFDRLLDAFYQINFYNLLHWPVKEEKRQTT